jgi:hypothetical protein
VPKWVLTLSVWGFRMLNIKINKLLSSFAILPLTHSQHLAYSLFCYFFYSQLTSYNNVHIFSISPRLIKNALNLSNMACEFRCRHKKNLKTA